MYWHPHIYRQFLYLLRLLSNEAEWLRRGWEREVDEETGTKRAPEEVAEVDKWLQKLVEAHLRGLFPMRHVVWKSVPKRAGRKSGLTDVPTDRVDVAWLTKDFQILRTAFRARLKAMRRKIGPTQVEAKAWYRQLAQAILEETSATAGVGWWSDWKEYETVVQTPAPPRVDYTCQASHSSPLHPKGDNLWLDTSTKPYVLKKYDALTGTWTTFGEIWANDVSQGMAVVEALHQPITEHTITRWKPLNLDTALDTMFQSERLKRTRPDSKKGSHGEGRAADLAYAVLAALVHKKPQQIRNAIDNYRRHHCRRKPRM
jgi:hypothetical protein